MSDRKDLFDELFDVQDGGVSLTLALIVVAFLIYCACK